VNYPIVHRRQFVIAKQEQRKNERWLTRSLDDGYILSYDADLAVSTVEHVTTIGTKLGEGRCATGRFLVIEWPYLYPDALGLLAAYFNETTISSSQALLGGPVHPPIVPRGINWDPDTRSPLIRRLRRDQRLHIPTLTVERIDTQLKPMPSYEAARDALARNLQSAVKEISASGRKIVLALTGGKDSRTLLAAMLTMGVKFEAMTFVLPNAPFEVPIAKRICKHFGIKHTAVSPNGNYPEKLARWKEHAFEGYNEVDKDLILTDQFRIFGPEDVVIRGGGFEVGQRFFSKHLAGLGFDASGEEIASRFKGYAPHVPQALDSWLEWRRGADSGLDLIDSFYLDQRAGGWLPAAEQGLDCLPPLSFHPANSLAVYDALITPTVHQREDYQLQIDAIQIMEAKLLRWPVNAPSWREPYRWFKNRARRAVNYLSR
jgi:hypothetical protein